MIQRRAHDAQIIRAKENLKLSYGGSSQRQALNTNQLIQALRQDHLEVWGLSHLRAIKEETTAINLDWVHNQARSMSHDLHAVSCSFITFDNCLKLITKMRLSNHIQLATLITHNL